MISQQEFDALLDRILQEGSIYQNIWGRQIFQRLLDDHSCSLSGSDVADFSHIQELLKNPFTTNQCQLAINLAILHMQEAIGKNCAKNIRESLIRGEKEITLHMLDKRDSDSMNNLNPGGWRALRKLLLKSPFTKLKLFLFAKEVSKAVHEDFFSLLALPTFECLTVITEVPSKNINVLWEVLAACQAEFLCLGPALNFLNMLGWEVFWNNTFKLKGLDLRNNSLNKLEEKELRALGTGVSNSHLTFLDVSGNDLEKLEDKKHKILWQAFSGSELFHLVVGYQSLTEQQWQIIYDTLVDNFTLFNVEFRQDQKIMLKRAVPARVRALLRRNKTFHDCQNTANNLIEKAQQLLKDLVQNEELSDHIVQVVDEITDTSSKIVSALALLSEKGSKKALQRADQLRRVLNELRWYQSRLSPGESLDVLLDITSESRYFRQARLNAFKIIFWNKYKLFEQEYLSIHPVLKEVLPKEQQQIFYRQAFLCAVHCLIDEESKLIHKSAQRGRTQLSDTQQKVFDTYLYRAAGGQGTFDSGEYSDAMCVALLQYVILSDVSQSDHCSILFSDFKKNTIFLDKVALLKLNTIRAEDCLKSDVQLKLQNLWTVFASIVDKLVFERNYKNDDLVLVKAVSQLSLKIGLPQKEERALRRSIFFKVARTKNEDNQSANEKSERLDLY